MPNWSDPTIVLTPLKSALLRGVAQKSRVLVRNQAPDADIGATRALFS